MNVSLVNHYQISSRNFDPLKNMCFVDGAYIPYMAYSYNEIMCFSETAHLISTQFYTNFPGVNLYQISSRNLDPSENMVFGADSTPVIPDIGAI